VKFGIAARLGVTLTLVALVSGGATGYMTYRESRERLVEEAQQRLIATATVAARRLSVTLEHAGRQVLMLSSGPEAVALLKRDVRTAPSLGRWHLQDNLASLFERQLRLNPLFAELRLIDREDFGAERLRVVRDGEQGVRRIDENDLREKGHLEYVRQGLTVPAGQLYGAPLTLRQAGGVQAGLGEPTLIITSVVVDAAGEVQGLVVLNLSLATLFRETLSDLPPRHVLYLTNRLGDYLLHPDPEKAFAFERGGRARVQDDFPETARLIGRAMPAAPVLVKPGETQQTHLAAFIRQEVAGGVSGSSFVFGLAQPLDDLLSSSRALAERGLQVMLMFSAAAIVAALLLARAMTRPLRDMALAVQRFSESGMVLPLPVMRSDEIGQLARAAAASHGRIAETLATLEQNRSELAHLARHDPLTGIANRLLFAERAEHALARAKRNGQRLAVLLIDLDGFKAVNDANGHAAGDEVLVVVSRRMRGLVRESDTLARLGGDEFVVLIEGVLAGEDGVIQVAQKLLAAIAQPIPWGQGALTVAASIGINCYPEGGEEFDALMKGADQAMYRAKAEREGFMLFR